MWALYVFGGLTVIIIGILLSDICIDVSYDKGFVIKAGIWKAFKTIFPQEEKPKKKKKKIEKAKQELEEKPDFDEFTEQLRTIMNLIGSAIKKVRLKPCKIHIVAAAEDAAKTAILYGACCAGLSVIETALSEMFGRYESDFSVIWDYQGKKTNVEANLKFKIRVFWILVVVRSAIFKILVHPKHPMKTIFSPEKAKEEYDNAKKSIKAE